MWQVFAAPTEQVGKILQYLSLCWAEDQGFRPVRFLVSWKSILLSPWYILVCALQEASGEFDRMEEGTSFDSALRLGGRSCKVDRSYKSNNPHQVPVDTALEVGLG